MTIYRQNKAVTPDEWRDGIKFLMGLGVNPTLSKGQQFLLKNLFGCNNNEAQATIALRTLGWRPTR